MCMCKKERKYNTRFGYGREPISFHFPDVGAGVIEADYHALVGVVLFKHSDADFTVKPRDCVAQMII